MSRRLRSIRLRLLAANLLILPLFLGFTAYGLDRAFGNYQLDKQRENMALQLLLLARAAEWSEGVWQTETVDEPRLALPDSGLYGFILSRQGAVAWQSESVALSGWDAGSPAGIASVAADAGFLSLPIGGSKFSDCYRGEPYYCYARVIAWGSRGPEALFLVLESKAAIIAARTEYRQFLGLLSLGLGLLLLVVQLAVVRWGLLPLRQITRDIDSLKTGTREKLDSDVAQELEPLTSGINVLLESEERRRRRVRNTVDRLTHTLKTPLMLVRNSREEGPAYRALVDEQVDRILGIVESELAAARLDGRVPDILGKAVQLKPVIERIARAYRKLPRVGRESEGEIELDTGAVDSGIEFPGEGRDLQDLFGSILENSVRYCRRRVEVGAALESAADGDWLRLTVGDDGDGIPPGFEALILERGARADTASVGQGLGLSIALAIVSAYGGSLHTGRSPLGGAEFVIRLPASQR
ncbi:ATP-binding protein [Seongchinamella sediminis]|nr:ATP-binding protein [Seongchinamella sediminis]